MIFKKEMYFDIQKGIKFISGYDRKKKNTSLSLIFIESEYLSRVRKVRVDDMAIGISILPFSMIFLLDFGTVPVLHTHFPPPPGKMSIY